MLKKLKEIMGKELKKAKRMMSHQTKDINKEREIIKSSQIEILKLKSEKTEMENLLDRLNNSFEEAEERICEPEAMNRSTEIIQFKVQKEKRMKKNKQVLRDLWDNICIIGVSKGENRENRTERIFEDIMA